MINRVTGIILCIVESDSFVFNRQAYASALLITIKKLFPQAGTPSI
jgi:hypothetical protein